MNILFVYYPLFVNWNHGVALLTAICRARGIEADYCPCGPEFLTKMLEYDTVGFSFVTDQDYEACIPYMRAAKKAGKTVLAGGVYARRGGFIEPALADHVCRGEAEILPDFLLFGDDTVFRSPYLQEDLDGLPLPDLSPVTGAEFHRGLPFLLEKKIIPYQTARGCPFRCAFCEVRYQPKGLRMKHTIAADLSELSAVHHPDLFYLCDELPPYWSEEWRAQWQGIHYPFMSYIRADIDPLQLEFLIEHGLTVAAFGVECGSEEFRNGILKKELTDTEIMRTTRILKKHVIEYLAFYMTGMPEETEEDRKATEQMIERVGGWPLVWQYQDLRKSIPETMEV